MRLMVQISSGHSSKYEETDTTISIVTAETVSSKKKKRHQIRSLASYLSPLLPLRLQRDVLWSRETQNSLPIGPLHSQ